MVEALYAKLSSEAEGARAAEERQEAMEALVRCKEEMGEQGENGAEEMDPVHVVISALLPISDIFDRFGHKWFMIR